MEENQQQADAQEQTNQAPVNPVNNVSPVGVATTAVSSDGPNGPFPQELNKWNWGAFLLSWIWSIGNSVWIGLLALLSFIPVVGPIISLVMVIMLGIKGNEWAWKAKKWDSVEQFKSVQAKWTKWGVILLVASIVIGVIVGVLVVVMGIAAVKSLPPVTVNSVNY